MRWTAAGAALFFGAALCGWAQEDLRGGLLDRDEAVAAAGDVTAEAYPDANEVLVAGIQRLVYEPDGTYVQWHEEYVKVLTEEGRRTHRTVSSHFTIPYQRGPEDCRIDLLEIIKPDGSVKTVDVAAQSRLMINPGSMSKNIYNPNQKVILVNVSDLGVGDVLHFVMYDRIVKPRMQDTWADWLVFESTRPIVRSIVEIHAPAALPLQRVVLKDEVPGTVTHTRGEDDGRMVHRWEARNVPRAFPEPNMPELYTVVQRVLVSTVPDWETVSRWYWNLSEPHYEPTQGIREKTAELVAGLEDDEARIRALFRFVSQEIRYMGITVEANAPGYEPHDVSDTFEARHGVCRDKAALLVVMLRLAGIEAFPTLIHNGPRKDAEVPQPYFNHAIAAARRPDGGYLLMDPTDETTAQLLPSYLDNKSYLVATPEGEKLLTSPVTPASANLMRVNTRASLDADGGLKADVHLRFEGINDNAYRGYFARARPEDRRRFFEGLVRRTVTGARLTDLRIEPADMLDTGRLLEVRLAYEADDVLVRGERKALLPLPVLGTRVGMVNFLVGRTGLEKRKYPLVTDMACGVQESLEMTVAPELRSLASLPVQEPVGDDTFSWSAAVTTNAAGLCARGDFMLNVVEFSPGQYLELKAGLKHIEQQMRKMPIVALQPAATDADAVTLDETVVYDVRDAANWTETRTVTLRILTYAGKKDNAELKLDYNTAQETVTVEAVLVTAADGKTQRIRPEEINLMDAPWVGSAPRYPASKTLVASFPAVDVGSTVAFRVKRECRDRSAFAAREYFRGFDDLRRKSVHVTAPAGFGLRARELHFDGRHEAGAGGDDDDDDGADARRTWSWTAEDAAAVEREDFLPPWWAFNPTVLVGSCPWSDYAAAVHAALARAAEARTAASRKAAELTAALTDPLDRVRAVRDFVALKIRPAGPPVHGLPLSAITDADRTLADGYGNTSDSAVLLAAMLRAAGFEPEFVLASSLAYTPTAVDAYREAAYPRLFGEVLVRVRAPAGASTGEGWIYLNDTDQYAALGACRHEGRLALTLPAGRFARIAPVREGRQEADYEVTLGEDGEAHIRSRRLVRGYGFGAERKRYEEMTPEERRRHFQELVAGMSQGAVAEGELQTDFSSYPGTVAFTVRVPGYAVRDGRYLYGTLPDSLLGTLRLRSESRLNPFYVAAPSRHRVACRVLAPAGFRADIVPQSWTQDGAADGQLRAASLTAVGRRAGAPEIRVEMRADLEAGVIVPGAYRELVDMDRRMSHRSARTLVLSRGEEPAGDAAPSAGARE
jgi:transglutaminase-like putative cysteine protease